MQTGGNNSWGFRRQEEAAKFCRRGWGDGNWRKKPIKDGGNIGTDRAKSLMVETEESLQR